LRDFTLRTYKLLISSLEDKGYRFYTFESFLKEHPSSALILRHDIDMYPYRAIPMAEYENKRSIRASYHFRVPERKTEGYEAAIIEIASLGHEIAYHYEDYSRAMFRERRRRRKNCDMNGALNGIEEAKNSFRNNLIYLRQFYPVKVISMHGNPLSRYDNRKLWEYTNYKDFGVICEPYLDINYNEVLYLTDTGRCWNARFANRRDKILNDSSRVDGKNRNLNLAVKSTFELLGEIHSGVMTEKIILNTHPQRWNDDIILWLSEYFGQNIRNLVKAILFRGNRMP
jgi:hypothetical protein